MFASLVLRHRTSLAAPPRRAAPHGHNTQLPFLRQAAPAACTMSAIRAAKNLVRKELKARVSAMASEEKARQSSEVAGLLLAHPAYQSCTRLSIYLNLPDEVSTLPILRHALAQGKACFIPR